MAAAAGRVLPLVFAAEPALSRIQGFFGGELYVGTAMRDQPSATARRAEVGGGALCRCGSTAWLRDAGEFVPGWAWTLTPDFSRTVN